MRRARHRLGRHRANLFEFLHQVILRVQPARRIRDEQVGPARLRGLNRIEYHRAGIAAWLWAQFSAGGQALAPVTPNLFGILIAGAAFGAVWAVRAARMVK